MRALFAGVGREVWARRKELAPPLLQKIQRLTAPLTKIHAHGCGSQLFVHHRLGFVCLCSREDLRSPTMESRKRKATIDLYRRVKVRKDAPESDDDGWDGVSNGSGLDERDESGEDEEDGDQVRKPP